MTSGMSAKGSALGTSDPESGVPANHAPAPRTPAASGNGTKRGRGAKTDTDFQGVQGGQGVQGVQGGQGVEADGTVCGYAYASPWRPKPAYRYTVEDTVYISPGRTGCGLGSALLGGLLDGCAAAGARQVIAVIADTGSDVSAALHRRFGFAEAGRLHGVGRKHGRWIDTVLMQRELGPGR
jgi:phosphinothricin acetyltransferase